MPAKTTSPLDKKKSKPQDDKKGKQSDETHEKGLGRGNSLKEKQKKDDAKKTTKVRYPENLRSVIRNIIKKKYGDRVQPSMKYLTRLCQVIYRHSKAMNKMMQSTKNETRPNSKQCKARIVVNSFAKLYEGIFDEDATLIAGASFPTKVDKTVRRAIQGVNDTLQKREEKKRKEKKAAEEKNKANEEKADKAKDAEPAAAAAPVPAPTTISTTTSKDKTKNSK
jgi:hypothetical protein